MFSIITPVFNSRKNLEKYFRGLYLQKFREFEVIFAYADSNDDTLNYIKSHQDDLNIKIINNPKKDAESGKALAIEKSIFEIVVLLDSDNEILNDNWLSECKNIFSSHSNIAIVETDLYYSKNDNIYNRVCNLLRSSDVFVRYFTPNFLRQKVIVQERFYTKYKFVNKLSPAIASGNGVFFRKEFLNDKINFTGRFEETNYSSHLLSKGFYFAVLKNIYTRHNYVGSLREYIKKRIKIAKKFNARRAITQKTWVDSIPFTYKLFIVIYSLLIIGPILEAFVLSIIKKDWAIMVMPLLLFITTLIYIYFYFLNFIKINFKIFFDQ